MQAPPAVNLVSPNGSGEGELLGNIYNNGALLTANDWYVQLTPNDSATSRRLHFWSGTMWASPTKHGGRSEWMYSWIDPRHQGACGDEYHYVHGQTIDLAARDTEIHWSGPNQPPNPAEKEKHCIQPGHYTLTLMHDVEAYKAIPIDYVPGAFGETARVSIWNSTACVYEDIEMQNYDDTSYMYHDLVASADISAAYGHHSVLYADSAGDTPYADTVFSDAGTLGGSPYTWFRFSSAPSTTTGITDPNGRLLSRLYWDSTNQFSRTGFWDSHSGRGYMMRIHQFSNATMTKTFWVGLEGMTPDRAPAVAPDTMRPIAITVGQGPPPLSNWISGPDLIGATGTYVWYQFGVGGHPPYNYGNWYYCRERYLAPTMVYYCPVMTQVGQGSSYSRAVTANEHYVFDLKAQATDSVGTQAQAWYAVEVLPGGLQARSANVRLQDGSCGQRPAGRTARQQWLRWVLEANKGFVVSCGGV